MTATFFGFNPPFIGGSQNVLSRQEDVRLIKNDILQLILTVPGERVMRPEFGTLARVTLFENDSDDTAIAMQADIRDKIDRFEPRVIVDSVEVTRNSDQQQYFVRIIATLRQNPQQEVIIEQFLDAPRTTQ